MKNNTELRDIIIAPRSFELMVYHMLGICMIVPGTIILLISLFALMNSNIKDFIIGVLISLLPLGLGALSISVSKKNRIRILFDKDLKSMKVVKKSTKERVFDVDQIISLHSQQVIHPLPGTRKYKLNAKISKDETINLFNEDLLSSGVRWDLFAERLACKIKKPLKKESWVEDKNISPFNLSGKRRSSASGASGASGDDH